jgi:hypothetical protein
LKSMTLLTALTGPPRFLLHRLAQGVLEARISAGPPGRNDKGAAAAAWSSHVGYEVRYRESPRATAERPVPGSEQGLARPSSLKHARSSYEPPPLPMIMTSTSPARLKYRSLHISLAASSPHGRRARPPRPTVPHLSCIPQLVPIAAPTGEVTTLRAGGTRRLLEVSVKRPSLELLFELEDRSR